MAKAGPRTVLFLCTGNYYRSRFAEGLFESVARRMGLPWRAASRGLALERGIGNVGPIAAVTLEAFERLGITGEVGTRSPLALTVADLEGAHRIVALDEDEHRPLMQERFADWAARAEYWRIADEVDALAKIEAEVMQLIARLLGGGAVVEEAPTPPAPAKPKERPVVRVGRETKGRKGKGVTTVADVPLDADSLRELAAILKSRCGTGGTVKDGVIEIQGDHRDRLAVELDKLGYRVKRVGG